MIKSKLGIIIPVHNGLSYTSKCLNNIYSAIMDLGTSRIEVIVVNDGSSDNTSEWIKLNYPQTSLLQGDGNLWWSGGINMGVHHAIQNLNCDYILWWNNDILTDNKYFKNILEIIDNQEIDIVGSKIYFADKPSLIWSMGGIFNTVTGDKYMIGMNEYDGEKFNIPQFVDWLPGMGTIIHKKVFNSIGFVDAKNFPQYHGDSDFTFRAKLAGYKLLVFPQLKIWNDKSNSGILHKNSYRSLINSLHSIKSNYHLGKDIHFYKRHVTSFRAYQTLIIKYCYYVGGFFKWKVLKTLGLSKRK